MSDFGSHPWISPDARYLFPAVGEQFPFETAPLGHRWPWYPYDTCILEVVAETANSVNVTVVAGTLHHGRVGVRRWVKGMARKVWPR